MNKTLGVVVGEPPQALQHARLDNIALVPASLLPLKGTYQPIANKLPTGSVLCVPGTQKQRTIMATVTKFFKDHGHIVILDHEKNSETTIRERNACALDYSIKTGQSQALLHETYIAVVILSSLTFVYKVVSEVSIVAHT
jgi:hypothetical protein